MRSLCEGFLKSEEGRLTVMVVVANLCTRATSERAWHSERNIAFGVRICRPLFDLPPPHIPTCVPTVCSKNASL